MTEEGLMELKEIQRKAFTLQFETAALMTRIQILLSDEDYKSKHVDTRLYLESAIESASEAVQNIISSANDIHKAYTMERDMTWVCKQINDQDNNEE